MLAHPFALAHLDLICRNLANTIISLAILSCNLLYSSQTQAGGEPWLVLDEPTWLDVRAEALETHGPVKNSSDSPSKADKYGGSISATRNDGELDNSHTSSHPCESSPDNAGETSPSNGACGWENLLFERPPSSLGFREDADEGKPTDTALASAPCVDIDLEIGLVESASELRAALFPISGTPSEPHIPSQELCQMYKLRSPLDSSTKSRNNIHQPRRQDGLELIKEEEELGLLEEEPEQGTSGPLISHWSFDSCEELDDGLIDPYSYEGEEVLSAVKRWLLLPSDLEPLAVLYKLSALKGALASLPDRVPTKTNLVRDKVFINLRGRADLHHGNVSFLQCLRRMRWEHLLLPVGKADREWIEGFLLALKSPRAPLTECRARSRVRGNKSSLRSAITAEYHLEGEQNLALSRVPVDYDTEVKGQGLQHGFRRLSERVQRLEDITWEILYEVEDLEMGACFLDVGLEFLDAKIESALEEEEAAFGSWLAQVQALQVRS